MKVQEKKSERIYTTPSKEIIFPWGKFEDCEMGRSRKTKNLPHRDFPGGTVVKNPPANAGDTGSSPGPERSHMPQSHKPVHHNY